MSDLVVYQTVAFPEPSARAPYRDPVFKTCMVRLTDRTKEIAAGDTSGGLKNEYSRVQSYNADESRILVRGTAATWYLYDGGSYQPLGKLPFEGPVDPRWDAVNPDLLYYSEGPRLMRYDTRSQQSSVLHDFTPDFPGQTLAVVWTRYEGSPSNDGRWWGLMAQDAQEHIVAFLVYDQTSDQITARRDLRGVALADTVDAVSISPLGTYFVAYFDYCAVGTRGSDASPCGFMVYDRSLKNGRGLLRIVGHSDLALDASGREVLVYQDIDTDTISVLDLETGVISPLWPIDFGFGAIGLHFSGRSLRLPGWATVSTTHDGVVNHTWMDDAVFVIELKPSGRVFRLAQTHSVVNPAEEHDYWAEPQASTNRDLTRILFTTNWGRSGTDQVETYAIELPSGWSGGGSCVPDSSSACLVGGRYKVTSRWRNQYAGGQVSTLSATRLTDTTTAFWLYGAETYEYLIRINTATDNGRAWVSIPTFTDVEFWIEVLDTLSGQYKEYHSPPGNRTLIYDPYFFVFP